MDGKTDLLETKETGEVLDLVSERDGRDERGEEGLGVRSGGLRGREKEREIEREREREYLGRCVEEARREEEELTDGGKGQG